MPKNIQATTFTQDQLRSFLTQLGGGRKNDGTSGRFQVLWDRIKDRDDHFYNRPAANPQFAPPYDQMAVYQSDILRQTHDKLTARMTENPFRVKVTPPKVTKIQAQTANDLELVLETGMELVEERTGANFQSEMADGQNIHCYGVIHWQKATDLLPDFPDPEFRDDLPDDDEAKRFHETPDEEDEDEEDADGKTRPVKRKGKFRERDEALRDRAKEAQALAGFPWHIEVIRPDQCAWIRDRSASEGFALFLYVRDVPKLDYIRKVEESDHVHISINEQNSSIRIFAEEDGPLPEELPGQTSGTAGSTMGWGEMVRVANIWTRDEAYELVTLTNNTTTDWELVKSWKHPYEQPPFELATATVLNHPEPSERYLPAMQGIFKVKPSWDYERSLHRALGEQIALPKVWIELADGKPMNDDLGNKLILTQNVGEAMTLPAGAKLVKLDMQMNPAFVESLSITREELNEATPETGFVDVGASTQPHTLNLAQAQANVPVKTLKDGQVRAVRKMLRNMALVMSKSAEDGGFGQTIWVYAKSDGERLTEDSIVGVDPSEIPSLDIDVTVDVNSSAQQIAIQEHGRARLNDPLDPLSRKQYLEDFVGEQNPQKRLEEHLADKIILEFEPEVVKQELAKEFGVVFIVSPEGTFVGMGGQAVTPEQVLAANGIQAQAPQASPAPGQAPGVLPQAAPAPLQPLGPLQGGNNGAVQ